MIRRDIGRQLHAIQIRDLRNRLRGGAVHLLANTYHALDHLPRNWRSDLRPLDLAIGGAEGCHGLFDRSIG